MLSFTLARSSRRILQKGLCSVLLGAFGLLLPNVAPAAQNSVSINVPHRTGPGQIEIRVLKITLQLDNSSPIALTVAGPAVRGSQTTQPMTLTSAVADCFTGSECFKDFTPDPTTNLPDRLTIYKPEMFGADPAS